MTVKTSIGDAIFRFKLFTGSAALGGFITAIFYPLHLAGFPDADLIQIFKIVGHVFGADPTTAWLMVACGAGLSFWLTWAAVARPWRGNSTPPKPGGNGVKKPW